MNHSDSSNQSFLPSSPTLHTCNPLTPEIGKEDIRFPISCVDGKPLKKGNPAKAVFGLMREESAIAECPITGIILSIGIPALPFTLTYENPIAKEKNARKIAALPVSELQTFENDILAGIFLSLLSANNLIEDRKTGLERNILLREAYQNSELVEMIQITSKVLNHFSKPEKLKAFVQESQLISLNDFADNVMPIVQGWLFSITPVSISKAGEEKLEKAKLQKAIQVKKPRGNISLSLRSKIKTLAASLKEKDKISQKASSIFQFLGTGQNWKTLTKESKVSYIAYLSEKEDNEDILELITLIKQIPVEDTYRILVEEEETVSDLVSKESPCEEAKEVMTLSQRLAMIAAKKGN